MEPRERGAPARARAEEARRRAPDSRFRGADLPRLLRRRQARGPARRAAGSVDGRSAGAGDRGRGGARPATRFIFGRLRERLRSAGRPFMEPRAGEDWGQGAPRPCKEGRGQKLVGQ